MRGLCSLALWLTWLLATSATPCTDTFVRLTPDGRGLSYRRNPLFLNGINLAWTSWGMDFTTSPNYGSGLGSYCGAEEALRFVRENGGNAIRLWLAEEPQQILTYHRRSGRVAGLREGVVETLQAVLELAAKYEVLVVLVLFNGALVRNQPGQQQDDCKLFGDEMVLNSLVEHAVRPLARANHGTHRPTASLAAQPPQPPTQLLRASVATGPASGRRAARLWLARNVRGCQ